jgi:hypothetical protein
MLSRRPGAWFCLLLPIVGCRFEVDPASIEIEVLRKGRYAVEAGVLESMDDASTISCDPGAIFGVDYRVTVKGGDFGTLPLSFWWVHPQLAVPSRKLWGTETRARSSEPALGWGERTLSGRALWALEHPEERVNGHYRFEIRRSNDGEILVRVPFEVEGC